MTRVAITTDRFETVAREFTGLGMEPVSTPCIRVETAGDRVLTRAREASSGADLVLITSPRTVGLLWPQGGMPPVAAAAVGVSSEAAIEAAGGRVVLRGRSGLASLVARAAEHLDFPRIVFPHAAGTDPESLRALRAMAPGLEEHEIYRAVPIAPGPASVGAVVFASPSAVAGWTRARDFDGLVVGVIGATTGDALARFRAPDVVAPEPTHGSLARALMSYLEVHA